jgi:hypothetical protein
MTKNWKKFTAKKNWIFFFLKLQFIYPLASIKNAQATGEAFKPQKEHPALQNIKILSVFLYL